jgi:hypothetical protein
MTSRSVLSSVIGFLENEPQMKMRSTSVTSIEYVSFKRGRSLHSLEEYIISSVTCDYKDLDTKTSIGLSISHPYKDNI